MNEQYPSRAIFCYGRSVHSNAENLIRCEKKHHALIKIIFLLSVFEFPSNAPVYRNLREINNPIYCAISKRPLYGSIIADAYKRMFGFCQPTKLVKFADCF